MCYHCFTLAVNKTLATLAPMERRHSRPEPQTDHLVKQRESPENTGFPAFLVGFMAFAWSVVSFQYW